MRRSEVKATIAKMKSAVRDSVKTASEVSERLSSGDPDVTKIEKIEDQVSLIKYLRGGLYGNWQNAENEERMFKALGQDAATRGGFFVPPKLAAGVIENLRETAVIRNMPGVRILPVSGTDKSVFTGIANSATISWGGEASTISEDTTLDFNQRTLETHKAVCLYKMSQEILLNASVDMEGIVRADIADGLALEEDKVILEGAGGQKPTGLYFNTRVVSTDLSGTIGIDNLKDALYQVRILQSGITGWVAHPRTVDDLTQLKDSVGRYMWGQGPGVATIDNLWGAPLKGTTQIAITGRPESDETYMVGGRWTDMIIGDGEGLRVDTTKDRYFETDQIGIKFVKFVGVMLRHPESFVVIKGIVDA